MGPAQPLATPQNSRSSLRHGGKRGQHLHPPPERSASFHGRTGTASPTDRPAKQMRRPKTQPDLLAGARAGGSRTTPSSPDAFGQGGAEQARRIPAKVLVNVNVQRSLGALQVMASTEWTVDQLIAAALKQYVKEGRRPPLPAADPSAFGLHYSQFSLECLDPKEKLMDLGSRNFFLCPKAAAAAASTSISVLPSAANSEAREAASSAACVAPCSKEADKASKTAANPWIRFMDFLF